MPPLKVGSFGRKGVNTVDSPLHLTDDDLAAAQNAEIFFEDGYPAIRKRLGIADGVTAAMAGEVLSVSSIPLPDPDPSHHVIAVLTAGAHRASADGTTWASIGALQSIDNATSGRRVSYGPDYFYYKHTGLTEQLRVYDGTTDDVSVDLTNDFLSSGGSCFYDRSNRKIYFAENHKVYEDGIDISGSTFSAAAVPGPITRSNGSLYLVTVDNPTLALATTIKLWRWNSGQSWTTLATITDAAPFYAVDAWDCNGVLYVSTNVGLCRLVGSFTRHIATGSYQGVFFHASKIFVSRRSGTDTIIESSDDGSSFTVEATLAAGGAGTEGASFVRFKGSLYAAVHNLGVYKRDDGAGTWSQVLNSSSVRGMIGAY